MTKPKNVTPPAELALIKAEATTPEARLDVIADDIRAEYGKGIEAQFSIGRLLSEAYDLFAGDDKNYGKWVAEQEFPFKTAQVRLLRLAAGKEEEVRDFITRRISDGQGDISVQTAVEYMERKPKPKLSIPTEETTPADPAYAALREAHRRIVTEGGFSTMHVDDLAASAVFIKELVGAYQSEKAARAV